MKKGIVIPILMLACRCLQAAEISAMAMLQKERRYPGQITTPWMPWQDTSDMSTQVENTNMTR